MSASASAASELVSKTGKSDFRIRAYPASSLDGSHIEKAFRNIHSYIISPDPVLDEDRRAILPKSCCPLLMTFSIGSTTWVRTIGSRPSALMGPPSKTTYLKASKFPTSHMHMHRQVAGGSILPLLSQTPWHKRKVSAIWNKVSVTLSSW